MKTTTKLKLLCATVLSAAGIACNSKPTKGTAADLSEGILFAKIDNHLVIDKVIRSTTAYCCPENPSTKPGGEWLPTVQYDSNGAFHTISFNGGYSLVTMKGSKGEAFLFCPKENCAERELVNADDELNTKMTQYGVKNGTLLRGVINNIVPGQPVVYDLGKSKVVGVVPRDRTDVNQYITRHLAAGATR